MFSQSFGADVYGTKARVIRIEADVSDGLPVFDMVGNGWYEYFRYPYTGGVL